MNSSRLKSVLSALRTVLISTLHAAPLPAPSFMFRSNAYASRPLHTPTSLPVLSTTLITSHDTFPPWFHALFSLGASGSGSGSGSASRRRTTMEAAGGFTEVCVTIGGSAPETVGEMEAVETCGVSVTVVVEASGKAEVEDLCEMTGVGASAEEAAVGV